MRSDREILETPRLRLRRPRATDASSVFQRYASDPQVTRYLGWPTHKSIEDTDGFLAYCDSEWERWPVGPYLVESGVDGRLLGSTGLGFETPEQAATGYVFARDAWGQGYATEALSAMRELARSLNVQRLYALCHPEHRASHHVLEKCGFLREGRLLAHAEFPNVAPGVQGDVFCYAAVFDL